MQIHNFLRAKRKSELQVFLEYILCFSIIINITSLWLRYGILHDYQPIIRMITPIATLALSLVKIISFGAIKVRRGFFYHLVLVCGCILYSLIANIDTAFNAIIQILLIIIAFLILSYTLDNNEIIDLFAVFVNIMLIIATVSLFFYLAGSTLGILQPTNVISYDWGDGLLANTYFYLYYEPFVQKSDIVLLGIQKNCAIFVEGTMYGFLLVIAYMFQRASTHLSILKNIIFILTILSTLSTMPILSILLFESILFFTHKHKNKTIRLMKKVFMPILLAIVPIAFFILISEKMTTGSYNVRYDHFVGSFKAFIDSFPFGIGYGNSEYLYDYFVYKQGLSVGIPYFIALGGLGALMLLMIPTLEYVCKAFIEKKWMNISFAITFIFIFFCTNIVYNSTLQWLIITAVFMKKLDLRNNRYYFKTI